MSISLAQWNAHPTLRVFALCLAALPNLNTLHILSCDFTKEDIREEFKKRRFPEIRTIVVPSLACPILQACPKARIVSFVEAGQCSDCLGYLMRSCTKVEELNGIMLNDFSIAEGKSFLVFFQLYATYSTAGLVKALTKLSRIKLVWLETENSDRLYCVPPSLQELVRLHLAAANTRFDYSDFRLATAPFGLVRLLKLEKIRPHHEDCWKTLLHFTNPEMLGTRKSRYRNIKTQIRE